MKMSLTKRDARNPFRRARKSLQQEILRAGYCILSSKNAIIVNPEIKVPYFSTGAYASCGFFLWRTKAGITHKSTLSQRVPFDSSNRDVLRVIDIIFGIFQKAFPIIVYGANLPASVPLDQHQALIKRLSQLEYPENILSAFLEIDGSAVRVGKFPTIQITFHEGREYDRDHKTPRVLPTITISTHDFSVAKLGIAIERFNAIIHELFANRKPIMGIEPLLTPLPRVDLRLSP
jgi:hypothetical protein